MKITCPHCMATRVELMLDGNEGILVEHHTPCVEKTHTRSSIGKDLLIDVQTICTWSGAKVVLQ